MSFWNYLGLAALSLMLYYSYCYNLFVFLSFLPDSGTHREGDEDELEEL